MTALLAVIAVNRCVDRRPGSVFAGMSEDRIFDNAVAATFYALLALFPGVGALVSIYGLFADPGTIGSHLDSIAGVLPGGAIDVMRDQLTRLSAQRKTKLAISFIVGLAVSVWSANGGIKALLDALNVVYEEREQRSFVERYATSLFFTIGIIGFLLIALACLVAVPVARSRLPGPIGWMVDIGRWPMLLLLVAVGLAIIFRYGPSRTRQCQRWLNWGSAFAAVAWLAAAAVF
jgi:membrane protein